MGLPPATDDEWAVFISDRTVSIPSNFPIYRSPPQLAISHTIDHTKVAPLTTQAEIDTLCAEAREHNFAAVCVRLDHVARAVQSLKDSPDTAVACVVSFPEGTSSTSEKVNEGRNAIALGASELDMVMNYPLLKQRKYTSVYEDVAAVRKAAPSPVKLKVIIETSQLSQGEIIAGCLVSCMAGADFVKTSTGLNGPGASSKNVALMRATLNQLERGCKVKASGGVRTAEECISMLKAGAERIGTSAGVEIMKGLDDGFKVAEQISRHQSY